MVPLGATHHNDLDAASSSSQTLKRRAACNRCHELKNKCSGPDRRDGICERCRRLGIQCVFGVRAVMGRPRKYKAKQSNSPCDTTSSPHCSEVSGTCSSVSNDDDSFLSRFLTPTTGEHGDLNLSSPTFDDETPQDSQTNPGPTIEFDWTNQVFNNNAFYPENMALQSNLPFFAEDHIAMTNLASTFDHNASSPQHFSGINPSSHIESGILQELLDVETKLQALDSWLRNTVALEAINEGLLSELLRNMQRLAEALDRQARADMDARNQNRYAQCSNHAFETRIDIDASSRTLLVLHTLTCYTYLLRLLEPWIQSLGISRAQGFNACHAIDLIHRMAKNVQDLVNKVIYCDSGMHSEWATPCREFSGSGGGGGGNFGPHMTPCSTVPNNVELAVDAVRAKEALVFGLLSHLSTADGSSSVN